MGYEERELLKEINDKIDIVKEINDKIDILINLFTEEEEETKENEMVQKNRIKQKLN